VKLNSLMKLEASLQEIDGRAGEPLPIEPVSLAVSSAIRRLEL
jgi:hypothetical protein